MINKTGALLYLRQPFVYASSYFTAGAVGFTVAAKDHPFTVPSLIQVKAASRTLKTTNYKATISGSFSTGEIGFINAIETPHGGVHLDTIHIGRVFNRVLEPSATNCFFNTGNMGSSNGTVTPKTPSAWAPEGLGEHPKADVYVLQATSTGASGVAKFRYATYPYNDVLYTFTGSYNYRLYSYTMSPAFYGETTSLSYNDSTKIITSNTAANSFSASGICAESRYISDGGTVTFVLTTDGKSVKIYSDPSLTVLGHEIDVKCSGSSVVLEFITYADGSLYGINASKVYKIDMSTGAATELTSANQTGTDCFIFANLQQTKVYCIVDGNVRIITVSDDSVSTPENSLPSTPERGKIFIDFMVDEEGNVWLKGKKYNGETLETMVTLPPYDYTHFYMHFPRCVVAQFRTDNYTYSLEGEVVKAISIGSGSYKGYFSVSPYAYGYKMQNSSMCLTVSLNSSTEDYKRCKYRTTQKDWFVHDGTSWVKGWYEGETPTGDIDSSNKTFTCQNTPTDLLEGKLSIVADGGDAITDNGDGTLSDGGTVTYSTGVFILNAAPTTSVVIYYELTSDAVTGTDIALQDGVEVDFEDGVETPHFVKDDYFSFAVAEGHIVDNLEAYTASVDLYVVPFFDISDETFTISATEMDAAATVLTGFIKIDSDIGLTGTIAAAEATIITTGDPTAGQIKVNYDSGALTFHADDNGKTATITYRWLQRPE